ncbi:MAG: amino acid adenylation domain-containing protein, partial [Nocardiaceae bacterium]|nr:amino acid adenylation domain-containing protein [Nocardiaceae bacterium]
VEPRPADTAQFDLQLTVTERSDSFEFEFTYDRDLYDRDTVAAFARRVVAFLDAMTGDPAVAVGDVDLLTDTERAALVPARGGHGAPESLWQALSRGVDANPDGAAIVAGAQTLTYRDLVRRAEALASVLHAHGVGVGTLVACVLERSVEAVVAIWAVARTGGAVVMIDPANPAERVAHMVRASGARIGVSAPHRIADLPATLEWVDVAATGRTELPDVVASPEHPAYVVFTSGTTGRPKGVLLTVRGLGALAADLRDVFAPGPASRVLHVASTGFDMALFEVLGAGTSGAALVIADRDSYAGTKLADLIDREGITHACLTPSVLGTVGGPALSTPGTLMLGGEAVPAELVRTWGPGRRLLNGYGPAESTAFATCTGPLLPGTPVTIGTPARGIDVLLLDPRLRPVPPGVVGELYLSGDRLAAGYVDDPVRTAERFVAGPGGRRWYRTGDLARWIDDGTRPTLEFRGRNDDQVKIRGVRVEPAEVDAILVRVPDVEQAATIVHESPTGAAELISYVSPAAVDVAAVRRALSEQLPRYMMPAGVVPVEALPLTVNGKVDVSRLPEPEYDAASPAVGAYEEIVARVFADVLGHAVGRFDDFFAVGGDSLLATTAVARLRDRVGRDVPLRLVFTDPTVAGVARALSEDTFAGIDSGPVVMPRPARIPLSRAQQRMWALRRVGNDASFRPSIRMEFRGPLDVDALREAFGDVAMRHEALRTRIEVDAAGPYAVVDAAAVDAEQISLSAGHDGIHVLDVTLDHLVVDGGSVAVLFHDLLIAYRARATGVVPTWEPLPLQYTDYVLWQQDRDVEVLLEQWRRSLDGFDPAVLPAGRTHAVGPVPPVSIEFGLAPSVAHRVARLATRFRASEFIVMHAVLAAVLARLTDHDDVGVAAVVSTRRHPQLEPLVGLFVETLVLRSRVTPEMTFGGLLAQVRDFDVAAFDRVDVPFEDVLRASQVTAPQVALAFQDFTPPAVRIGELEVNARELGGGSAEFDLVLTLSRSVDGGYDAVLAGDPTRIEPALARTVADQFASVLTAVDADLRVRDLPMATSEALHGGEPPLSERLADLLRATAAAHPDRIAVIDGARRLTYRELDARSDELAALSGRRAGDATGIVDIGPTRSLERIENLWAVAKSRHAFGGVDAATVAAVGA